MTTDPLPPPGLYTVHFEPPARYRKRCSRNGFLEYQVLGPTRARLTKADKDGIRHLRIQDDLFRSEQNPEHVTSWHAERIDQ